MGRFVESLLLAPFKYFEKSFLCPFIKNYSMLVHVYNLCEHQSPLLDFLGVLKQFGIFLEWKESIKVKCFLKNTHNLSFLSPVWICLLCLLCVLFSKKFVLVGIKVDKINLILCKAARSTKKILRMKMKLWLITSRSRVPSWSRWKAGERLAEKCSQVLMFHLHLNLLHQSKECIRQRKTC